MQGRVSPDAPGAPERKARKDAPNPQAPKLSANPQIRQHRVIKPAASSTAPCTANSARRCVWNNSPFRTLAELIALPLSGLVRHGSPLPRSLSTKRAETDAYVGRGKGQYPEAATVRVSVRRSAGYTSELETRTDSIQMRRFWWHWRRQAASGGLRPHVYNGCRWTG